MASYGGVATISVATLGFCSPTSCAMSSRHLTVPNLAYGGGVTTNGIVFPMSCPVTFRGSPTLYMASYGGIATINIGFPTSCPMSSRGLSLPNMLSCGVVATTGEATLGISFQVSCPMASLSQFSQKVFVSALRRSASVFSVVCTGIRKRNSTKYGIFCRLATIGVSTLGVGFSTLCPVASRGSSVLNVASFDGVAKLGVGFLVSCLMASRGSPTKNVASFGIVATLGIAMLGVSCPSCVRWHPDFHLC